MGICMDGEKHWLRPLRRVGDGYGDDTKGLRPVGNVTWIGSVQAEAGRGRAEPNKKTRLNCVRKYGAGVNLRHAWLTHPSKK